MDKFIGDIAKYAAIALLIQYLASRDLARPLLSGALVVVQIIVLILLMVVLRAWIYGNRPSRIRTLFLPLLIVWVGIQYGALVPVVIAALAPPISQNPFVGYFLIQAVVVLIIYFATGGPKKLISLGLGKPKVALAVGAVIGCVATAWDIYRHFDSYVSAAPWVK